MKTIWNIIKAETNRVKETANIIIKILPRLSTDIFCQYPKLLLMVLEVTLANMPTLLKTPTISWQTYFMHPFLAQSFKTRQLERLRKLLTL